MSEMFRQLLPSRPIGNFPLANSELVTAVWCVFKCCGWNKIDALNIFVRVKCNLYIFSAYVSFCILMQPQKMMTDVFWSCWPVASLSSSYMLFFFWRDLSLFLITYTKYMQTIFHKAIELLENASVKSKILKIKTLFISSCKTSFGYILVS